MRGHGIPDTQGERLGYQILKVRGWVTRYSRREAGLPDTQGERLGYQILKVRGWDTRYSR